MVKWNYGNNNITSNGFKMFNDLPGHYMLRDYNHRLRSALYKGLLFLKPNHTRSDGPSPQIMGGYC